MTFLSQPPGQLTQRLPWLDMARGAAVILMVIYHFAWDLSYQGFVETDINRELGWRLFARFIAGSFLFLSGISFWLQHRSGFDGHKFLRRLAVIAGAAALVTLGTWYAFPSSYVFFGILHCIALSSVLAIPFLRAPPWLTLLVAALVFAAPFYVSNAFFDAPILAFIGLRTFPPMTNDYVPLLPWAAPMLAGLGLGQWLLRDAGRSGPAVPEMVRRPLALLGRHSLLIYLLHQPVLFGATALAASYLQPAVNDASGEFLSACEARCVKTGAVRQTCIEQCYCTLDGLEKTGVWASIAKGANDEKTIQAINRMSSVCQR